MSGHQQPQPRSVVCVNRRAKFNYEVIETLEAGIVLTGSETKSLREGRANLADAYIRIEEKEALLIGLEIQPYSNDTTDIAAPRRARRLLLHRREIARLARQAHEKGVTLVALSVYFSGPWAKIEVALVKGRRKRDKRQAIRQREAKRDIDRATRRRR